MEFIKYHDDPHVVIQIDKDNGRFMWWFFDPADHSVWMPLHEDDAYYTEPEAYTHIDPADVAKEFRANGEEIVAEIIERAFCLTP